MEKEKLESQDYEPIHQLFPPPPLPNPQTQTPRPLQIFSMLSGI